MSAAITRSYNLGRLGNAGDQVLIEAGEAECAAIAQLAQILSVPRFVADVTLSKLGATRYQLDYRLEADVVQACVVTLEPVAGSVARNFRRELHFIGTGARRPADADLDLSGGDEEEPEEIESLHYDLAGPALEEFLLGLEPYPRRPGVEFDPSQVGDPPPESPFAVLKSLKSRT
jgi:hypothetical protein